MKKFIFFRNKKEEGSDKEVFSVRGSRKLYIPIYLMAIFLIAVIVIIKIKGLDLNKGVMILVALFVFVSIKMTELHRLNHKYTIKSPSLIHTEGILNKNSRRVDLFAISDVDVVQSLWQRILNFGDVGVRLFSAESLTPIKHINQPTKFAETLEREMALLRSKKR